MFVSSDKIFVVSPNGRGLRQLTRGKSPDSSPAWSPKGGRIAFVRHDAIWTMRADGSLQRQLTWHRRDNQPAWTPDGRYIAFVRGHDLWVMGAQGHKAHRVVRNAELPSWSPNGRLIATEAGRALALRLWPWREHAPDCARWSRSTGPRSGTTGTGSPSLVRLSDESVMLAWAGAELERRRPRVESDSR